MTDKEIQDLIRKEVNKHWSLMPDWQKKEITASLERIAIKVCGLYGD